MYKYMRMALLGDVYSLKFENIVCSKINNTFLAGKIIALTYTNIRVTAESVQKVIISRNCKLFHALFSDLFIFGNVILYYSGI